MLGIHSNIYSINLGGKHNQIFYILITQTLYFDC